MESKAENIVDAILMHAPRISIQGDGFKLMIATILSQNTSSSNQLRAYSNLERLGLDPWNLARMDPGRLEQELKPAGIQKMRARRLIELSREIVSRYHGDLSWIKHLELDEARKMLLSLPGVGPKTADIMLLFWGNKPVFPVDRHISRIAIRLGWVDSKDYDTIRSKLESIFHPRDYLRAHLGLIQIGRRYCRPSNPRCNQCALGSWCSRKSVN